jgi:hypothetical protein
VIILDTNVVSESIRPTPDQKVVAWLDTQQNNTLLITTVTVAELKSGVEQKPDGRRKEDLRKKILEIVDVFTDGRVLPFDMAAADCYARLFAAAIRNGHGISILDAQIAAIATAHHMAVATRDTGPFRRSGLRVINPWDDDPAAQK